MGPLAGKSVLITGASSGLGFAAAEAFAKEGCDVALLARGREGLQKAAKRVRAHGRRALVTPADVTDRDAVQAAVDRTVKEFGTLDVLVLCAAGTVFGPFLEVEPEDFDRVTDVTYTGAVNCVRAALPELERSAGTIVATGSLMTKVPLPTFSSYAAAKHAERGFLNSLRVELKATRSPVEVAQLHPGAINTPVWDNTRSATGFLPRRPPENYSPHEVAGALVQLAENPKAEMMFGGEARAIQWLFENVRPAGDLLLSVVHHYYLSGKRPAVSDVNALWTSVGKGVAANGSFQRPSLTRLATAPWRAMVRS
jgi:NAD(P)-dependent dehydrogenase (short-subunit alcohol dehydrogenase family)